MGLVRSAIGIVVLGAASVSLSAAQQTQAQPPQGVVVAPVQEQAPDVVRQLVARLDLEKYKATVKGLTQFGDRREGTERNRKAVDWIEAQLKSYGCDTARMSYNPADYGRQQTGGRGQGRGGLTSQAGRGQTPQAGRGTQGGRGRGTEPARTPAGTPEDPVRRGPGGKGFGGPTGVNNDPMRQPDEALRKLNMEPVIPGNVDQVYCTKVGTTRPNEMYIIGGHMEGSVTPRPPTTTGRGPRSRWSWRAFSACRTSPPR